MTDIEKQTAKKILTKLCKNFAELQEVHFFADQMDNTIEVSVKTLIDIGNEYGLNFMDISRDVGLSHDFYISLGQTIFPNKKSNE